MRSIEATSGSYEYINDFRISVQTEHNEKLRKLPGSTAIHEATHAVAAIKNGTGVKTMTIEPGPGYLGLTVLDKPDPIAAAAPHADGCSGTGHDMHIVAAMGHDAGATTRAASSITASSREEIKAVASTLEEKRTMDGSEIQSAMNHVQENKQGKEIATVSIKAPDGGERTLKTNVQSGIVMIPGEWISLN